MSPDDSRFDEGMFNLLVTILCAYQLQTAGVTTQAKWNSFRAVGPAGHPTQAEDMLATAQAVAIFIIAGNKPFFPQLDEQI